jgi:CMP/dCMP kinase
MIQELFAITISHQLGSGGAYLGQKLSERLGLPLIDREVLKKVAEQFNLDEDDLQGREERLSSFWQSYLRVAALTDPMECITMSGYLPSDSELFQIESEYIARIAEKRSAIFLGRCGRYILRDHPTHLNLFVHAALPERIKRVQQLYCTGESEAKKLIVTNDRERDAYLHAFTHQDWLDARGYDLCLNTSSLGLEKSVAITLAFIQDWLNIRGLNSSSPAAVLSSQVK